MEYKNYQGESLRKYNLVYNKYLTPLHDVYVSLLDMKYMQHFFDNLEASKDILKHIKIALKGSFEYGAKRGYIPLSYLEMFKLLDIKPTKKTKEVARAVFTPEEIRYLWDHSDDAIYKVILFYIYTGLRFSELKNAEWYDDHIHVTKAKTPAGIRDVPLSDKAKSLLPLPEIDYYNYRYALQLLEKHTGTKHTAHDTRHTFISLMTEAGVDARIIKKIVGHARGDITEDIYTHISLLAMLEAVNKI